MSIVHLFNIKAEALLERAAELGERIDTLSIFETEVEGEDLKQIWSDLQSVYMEIAMESEGDEEGRITSEEKARVRSKLAECRRTYLAKAARMREVTSTSRFGHSTSLPQIPNDQASHRAGQEYPGNYQDHRLMYNPEAIPTPALRTERGMRLPPCDTEIFDGDFAAWPSFRDLFSAIYRSHPGLTEVEKLCHLRSKTRGDAFELIRGWPMTHDSFEPAWQSLCEQYENTRVLVTQQLMRLMQLPKVKEGDRDGLRELQRAVNNCVSTFKVLKLTGEDFQNAVVTHVCGSKLAPQDLDLWELSLSDQKVIPQWKAMDKFLSQRCGALYAASDMTGGHTANTDPVVRRRVHRVGLEPLCRLCSGQRHALASCHRFQQMRVLDRLGVIRRHKLCRNCLGTSHWAQECQSEGSCHKCQGRHHTLVHFEDRKPQAERDSSSGLMVTRNTPNVEESDSTVNADKEGRQLRERDQRSDDQPSCYQRSCRHSGIASHVVLGTAMVMVMGGGREFAVKAIIDSGSEATFITQRLQRKLAVPTTPLAVQVTGVNSVLSAQITRSCVINIRSQYDKNVQVEANALVIPSLTGISNHGMPQRTIGKDADLPLADPQFYQGGSVEVLIGGDLYPKVMRGGMRHGVLGSLVAQETVFGWVLTGPLPIVKALTTRIEITCEETLDMQLRKFWEVESIQPEKVMTDEEQWCEQVFQKTTTRTADGRYVVSLPFKPAFGPNGQLGDSRKGAVRQLERGERRLGRSPELGQEYRRVLQEYIEAGHMVKVDTHVSGEEEGFYLPHHAVIKPSSETTKVRVVFNASQPTMKGISLNDVLYPGPALQNDLVSVLSRWRVFQFVFNADVEKMYRQIRVNAEHTKFQRIVHRLQPGNEVEDFELRTVTFGVNAAPYLALRTLLQLAADEEKEFPTAAGIIRDNFYVDDVLGGGHCLESTMAARRELDSVLNSGGFPLRKWTANDARILHGVEEHHQLMKGYRAFGSVRKSGSVSVESVRAKVERELQGVDEQASYVPLGDDGITKTLGILWDVQRDTFCFRISRPSAKERHSKREVLSITAKLFDPAGWLAPIIVAAKMLMQELWLRKLDWDEDIPLEIEEGWQKFLDGYEEIGKITIPRWLGITPTATVQVHGFCDASEKAFAAALYVRVKHEGGQWESHLIGAKTKVAPVKTLTIPRLELCGAALLADLASWLVPAMKITPSEIRMWTDSTIVLSWLAKEPNTWSTFVANRVAKISRKLDGARWGHVASEDNPADLASRGVTADRLGEGSIWWTGPEWLSKEEYLWPQVELSTPSKVPEERPIQRIVTHLEIHDEVVTRFSDFARMLRVLAYALRFLAKCRKHPSESGALLTVAEIKSTKLRLVRGCQRAYFAREIALLSNGGAVPTSGGFSQLNPFMDEDGILRVGGRLALATSMTYSERCPIILPTTSHFTRLLVKYVHIMSIHGGNGLMLRLIRMEWWIPRVKQVVKAVVHQCKVCVIFRKNLRKQMMAPLPKWRTVFARAFTTTGIDFAGPFDVKTYTGRACKVTKGYICLMVCFTTRALHLEATSELSTASFLAAFARFVARRGCPRTVFSDNGTNFVGASRVIKKEWMETMQSLGEQVQTEYAQRELEWRFIPPGAPHMGGLWEAGVKSVKTLFKKGMTNQRFTYEEMTTVLARVEATLNSRPMVPVSEDPSSLEPLTPGHFLVGGPLLARAETVLTEPAESIRNRWLRVSAIAQEIAIRWKEEYLTSLHARTKWKRPEKDIAIGDMVIIRHENLPSTDWRLGRVVALHPGSDGRVRVATIRTAKGEVVRPVVKLVVLPMEEWEPRRSDRK